MNVWGESLLYRVWVIGGLIGVVAFAVIGGLSDPTNQDFVLYLIPVIAIWVAGIFILQWRGVAKDERAQKPENAATTGLVTWNLRFGMFLCAGIFIGVFLFYAGVDKTFYPLGESGPGLPLVLIPPVVMALIGAGHAMGVLRSLQRGDIGADSEPKGPTDFDPS